MSTLEDSIRRLNEQQGNVWEAQREVDSMALVLAPQVVAHFNQFLDGIKDLLPAEVKDVRADNAIYSPETGFYRLVGRGFHSFVYQSADAKNRALEAKLKEYRGNAPWIGQFSEC